MQESASSETEVVHTRRLKILHRRPRAVHAPRGRRRVPSTRAIFAPSRAVYAEPQAESSRASSRSVRRAEPSRFQPPARRRNIPWNIPWNIPRIFPRIFPVQPSEPPTVQNWFFDRFTHFLTRFQQSQTGSRLFGPFRSDLQCPFGQIRLPKGDIVI